MPLALLINFKVPRAWYSCYLPAQNAIKPNHPSVPSSGTFCWMHQMSSCGDLLFDLSLFQAYCLLARLALASRY